MDLLLRGSFSFFAPGHVTCFFVPGLAFTDHCRRLTATLRHLSEITIIYGIGEGRDCILCIVNRCRYKSTVKHWHKETQLIEQQLAAEPYERFKISICEIHVSPEYPTSL